MSDSLDIQVDAMELLQHGGIENFLSHLNKHNKSYMAQVPEPEKPEVAFAMINVMVNMLHAVQTVDSKNPEGVVLQAFSKNYVRPDSMATLASGGTVTPTNPKEMQSAEFTNTLKALQAKYKDDPGKRDALACMAAAAAQKRPLTTNEILQVFQHLAGGIELTPQQRAQVVQNMTKQMPISAEVAKKLSAQAQSGFDLASVVAQNVNVQSDGTFTPRDPQSSPAQAENPAAVAAVEETTAAVALFNDFWDAFFKANKTTQMQEEQKQMAEVLRNAGAMYVKQTRHGTPFKSATVVDATAHRFLIKKLRASPLVKASRVRMAAVEKLAQADETGQAPAPEELVEIFGALGAGVQMTPEMMKATLEGMQVKQSGEVSDLKDLMGQDGMANPVEVIKAVNKATLKKPEEANAALDLYVNMFIALADTKLTAKMTDQRQREVAETLKMAGQIHGRGAGSGSGKTAPSPAAVDAYRLTLTKLRNDPTLKADKAKADAVDALVIAQATGKNPSPNQLLEVFKDLGRGVVLTPDMLRVTLEHMCTAMRAISPNEKIELQKRFKSNPGSATDMVKETDKVRGETKQLQEQAKLAGCFQIVPQWATQGRGAQTAVTPVRRMGMLSGPTGLGGVGMYHQYKAATANSSPASEMARVVLVQSKIEEVKAEDVTLQSMKGDATQMTFRSVLQPTVIAKYQQTLKGDKAASSALQGLSKVSSMDDKTLNKKVDELLDTLTIERGNLRAVLNQLVKDRVMTNDEARVVEHACAEKLASGGGKMKLSELQEVIRKKQGK